MQFVSIFVGYFVSQIGFHYNFFKYLKIFVSFVKCFVLFDLFFHIT